MNSPLGDARTLDTNKWAARYLDNFQENAQRLTDCLITTNSFVEGQTLNAETKVALLDLENAIDSALLTMNTDFATSIEALSKTAALEKVAQAAASECDIRRSDAEDVSNDLDAILEIYERPIEIRDPDEEPFDVETMVPSSRLDQYRDFSRVVFGVHDPSAKRPTKKEATATIQSALREKELLAQDEEDGLEVGESIVKPVCPISSMLLEEPVKASCGHYFSQAPILDVIRKNGGEMLCPSRGCENRVSAAQLVRDRMMDLKVMQYLRMEDAARHRARQLESMTVGRVV